MNQADICSQIAGTTIIHQKLKNYDVGNHFHDQHEFFFPIISDITVSIGQHTWLVKAGQAFYIPPRTIHSFQSNPKGHAERLILLIDELPIPKKKTLPKVFQVHNLMIELVFYLLLYPNRNSHKALLTALKQVLQEAFEEENRVYQNGINLLIGITKDLRLRKALLYIEENYQNPLTIKMVCASAGLSTRSLNRLTTDELQLTPKQIITMARMERAKELIRIQNKSVTEVAFEVGYNSISQFVSSFRKYTGTTPRQLLIRD